MKSLVNITVLKLAVVVGISLSLMQCASRPTTFRDVNQPLAFVLGSAAGCQVSASHPLGHNNGRIRLGATSATRSVYGDLFTGRSLTNTQVLRRVCSAFDRAATAAPGSNLYTLGKRKYGGEAHFIAQPGGGVAIQYYGNASGSSSFDGHEVRILRDLITQALAR